MNWIWKTFLYFICNVKKLGDLKGKLWTFQNVKISPLFIAFSYPLPDSINLTHFWELNSIKMPFQIQLHTTYLAGLLQPGSRGLGTRDQLTLSQPWGKIRPTTILLAPPGFTDLPTALLVHTLLEFYNRVQRALEPRISVASE